MNRFPTFRSFLLAFAMIELANVSIRTSAVAADAAAPKPNILYILADDMGWADAGFNGGDIRTPNIDKIAAAGAKLAQFYVQPVCSPTRASLMTGRYPMRLGLQVGVVRPWAQYGLPLDERTLPQALKEAGYETAICGKWHLGHFTPDYLPTHRGFDHQYGHYNGALDYFTHIRDGGFDWHRDDKVNHDEGYSTFLDAREAVRLIEAHDKAKPLFLYVPFNAVHAPHQVPEKYPAMYPNLTGVRKTYAGMVAAMDEAIGQILDAVDKKGIRKDTLIIFSSDNGGPAPGKVTSNGPYRAGKGTLYEGGVRVCAAAAWEGHIKAGSTVNEPIHMTDWYPTLLKLAGATLEQRMPLDGKDVWPTITEGKPSPRTEIIHNSTPTNGAIRMGDWKLVINGKQRDADEGGAAEGAATPAAGAPAAEGAAANPRPRRAAAAAAAAAAGEPLLELFNIAQDPYEKKNLASEQPEKLKELKARYDKLAVEAVAPRAAPAVKGFKAPKVWGEKD